MRLIDADAFKEYIQGACDEMSHMYKDGGKLAKRITDSFCMDIDEQPTVDAVEVIRCKDCKWFNDWGCAIRIIDDTDKPKETDFCSFAERRKDES